MKAELHGDYLGYEIWHRPRIKRCPWRAQVPGAPGHFADKATLEEARAFIANCLRRQQVADLRSRAQALVDELNQIPGVEAKLK